VGGGRHLLAHVVVAIVEGWLQRGASGLYEIALRSHVDKLQMQSADISLGLHAASGYFSNGLSAPSLRRSLTLQGLQDVQCVPIGIPIEGRLEKIDYFGCMRVFFL
jgi:hypothetical protein